MPDIKRHCQTFSRMVDCHPAFPFMTTRTKPDPEGATATGHAPPSSRYATLKTLRRSLLPAFLCPVPSDKVLRDWANKAGIKRLKPNPKAKHGGGVVWYSVSGWEKYLQTLIR